MTASTRPGFREYGADPTGAVVVNGQVTLMQQETGLKRTATTNENGDFEFPDLQRGTYRLTATASGFKTFVAENILLEANQTRRINVALELGAVGAEVTVVAGAAVISTESAKIQGVISGGKHFDTPWVAAEATLDPSRMLTTLPLVSQTTGVWYAQWAGQDRSQVQQGQDGHTNDRDVNQINDILDTQEITVVTVNNTAEFARVGHMNMVTKSGSNDFHGRLAYWHQNSALGAREFFETRKAKLLIHTISVSAAGPIIRNKTFFYASGNFLKIPGSQFYLRDVPTAKMRTGDFSQLLSISRPVTVKDPLTGNAFPGNLIPPSRLDPLTAKVTDKYIPLPNRGGPDALASNYGYTDPFPTDYSLREDFTQRIDHHLSEKNRISGRLITNWGLYGRSRPFPAFTDPSRRFNVHLVFEDTHVFSPSLVNTARVGLYKERHDYGVNILGLTSMKGDAVVKELGLQGVNPKGLSGQGFPRMDITGYPTLSVSAGGMRINDHDWGIADSVTWSKGRHVVKLGGEFKPQSVAENRVSEGNYGNFNFNGSFSGYGYADFALGVPYTAGRLDPLMPRTRLDSELGLYVTDDFKVSSRLTLNLGVRWDRFGAADYEDGLIYRWDLATGNMLIPEKAVSKVSPLYPKTITVTAGQAKQNPYKKNFAPRIGAAYRVGGGTVIRGGYGIFSETLGRFARIQGGGPFEIAETYYNTITAGKPLLAFPNPYPSSLAGAAIPSQSFTGYPLGPENGRIHQFSLTIERQVRDTGLRISYVGSRNRGMNYSITINKPAPSLTPFTASRRPWPQFSGGSYFRSDGAQNFNALTLQAQRKLGRLTFDGHWTWASNYTNMVNRENPYAPLFWTRDAYTPRQRAVINAIWEIPVGRGRTYLASAPAAVNHVLGGWQLYWIVYAETGHFFMPSFSGRDPSNTNTSGGCPDRICNGNLPPGQRTISRWFDTSCFTVPPAGRFGNSGSNVLEGPGYHLHNVSIAKTFDLTERFKFTFTAAASNAFNHPNFMTPSANISAPGSVGVISNLVEGGRSRRGEIRGRLDF